MIFRNPKKDRQTRDALYAQREAEVESAITAAKKIKDPAEKERELRSIAFDGLLEDHRGKIALNDEAHKAAGRALKTGLGVSFAAAAGFGAVTGGVGAIIGFPSMWLSLAASKLYEDSLTRKLSQEANSHFSRMQGLYAQARDATSENKPALPRTKTTPAIIENQPRRS